MGNILSGLPSEAQKLLLATRSGDASSVAKVSSVVSEASMRMEITAH